MTKPENANIKELQTRVLTIYKDIKKLCDDNNIHYIAIGGTAIGTIRHRGFIPWDDDIDIAMPREDYERFKKLTNQLPSHLRFVDYADDPNSPIPFSKVQDLNTCYTSSNDMDNPNTYYGIFVDIMPLDGVPKSTVTYKLFRLHLRILLSLQHLVIQYEHRTKTPTDNPMKESLRYLCGILSKLGLLNKVTLKREYSKLVTKYPLEMSEYTACLWQFVGAGINLAARFPMQDRTSCLDMPFEDTTMRMPLDYEGYFAAVCPDYMTLPPKNKQVPLHSGIIDFNKSYLEYANEIRQKNNGK